MKATIKLLCSLALTLSLASGCGGTNSIGGSAPLTQAQALAVTADLFAAMASAPLSVGGTAQTVHLSNEGVRIRNAVPAGALGAPATADPNLAHETVPATSTTTISIPPYTYNCPAGGTIAVSGSFTGTYDVTATPPSMNVSENVLETISRCDDKGTVINGNPSVAISGTTTLVGNIFTDLTSVDGGVTVNGADCAINVTISATLNDSTNAESGSINGSVCGVNVTGTF